MRIITVDCSKMGTEKEFLESYVSAALAEGRGYFGCNLAAFWDAVSAGGPGWPGEDCEIRFINTAPIKLFRNGEFYAALMRIVTDSKFVRIFVD